MEQTPGGTCGRQETRGRSDPFSSIREAGPRELPPNFVRTWTSEVPSSPDTAAGPWQHTEGGPGQTKEPVPAGTSTSLPPGHRPPSSASSLVPNPEQPSVPGRKDRTSPAPAADKDPETGGSCGPARRLSSRWPAFFPERSGPGLGDDTRMAGWAGSQQAAGSAGGDGPSIRQPPCVRGFQARSLGQRSEVC